ncbi:Endonuclease YncB, thermonuclease family [Microbacterium saccharophilum]|uniref:Endonuclease YncB, thermonuclease family n=1 Tax=Microbacterium saccharophilum TaxID=1213358 RepID=A0A7Z7GCY4_9MICO|nr:Endonuclease YncB, thermonuclease family [Microbacterium saccharophilum]
MLRERRNGERVRVGRTLGSIGAAVIIAAVLSACVTQPARTDAAASTPVPLATPAASVPAEPAAEPVTFVSVVDGDTIETSAGTVRIIGIDTPERGECGHDESSATIAGVLAGGDPVTLELPAGQDDQDRYGRLLRHVSTASGIDLGMLQIQAGTAVARYDSLDGYPAHPWEAEYRSAQRATLGADGSVVTVACQPAAAAPPAPVAPVVPTTERWWEQYTSCTKLKKNGAGHPTGPFQQNDPADAELYEWFANGTGNHGDGDGDGLACE